MNKADMRVLGASAVTAAAVALITIIVYEGHVKASSEGRTVVVEPGATFEVRPEAPDREGLAVGGGVALDEMRRELRALQERVEVAEKALAAKDAPDPAPAPPAPADKTSPFLPVRPPVERAGCDDEALTERGREQFSSGQYAAAFVTFEQAYACRPDPSHAEKAIVAACNLPSVEKAARQWRRLPPVQRNRILGVCVRNGITVEQLEDGAAALASRGALRVIGTPQLQVFVDGKQVGVAPLQIELPPGRHAVKLVAGNATHTEEIEIERGVTVTVVKSGEGVTVNKAPANR